MPVFPKASAGPVRCIGLLITICCLGAQAHDLVPSTVGALQSSGIISENLDPIVRPQDDFFGYANGSWLNKVAIPDDQSSWGVSEAMTQKALEQLRDLMAAAVQSSDPEEQKVGRFYASFMDEARVDALGLEPIRAELQSIAALGDRSALSTALASLAQAGVNTPVALSIDPDPRHSTHYAVTLSQSGLGLPDRDYYLRDAARFVAVRRSYRDYIAQLLTLAGEPDGAARAARVLDLETRLARVQWSATENLDPVRTYNPLAVSLLEHHAGPLVWERYLEAAGVRTKVDFVILAQPSYIRGLETLWGTTPLETWRDYLRVRLLAARAPYLGAPFARTSFAFEGTVLNGIPQQKERWLRAVQLVDRLFGEASGKMYVARYFPPENKAKVETLVRNILAAYALRIDQLDWMSESTKREARAKLAKIHIKVGYPDRWRDYSNLRIEADDLVGNVRRATLFETARNLAKLGQPIDVGEWQMTAPTVDAYYDASHNEIVFPAGILQPPAYVAEADDAFNYGATGATIGHEISHGFDESGDKFDSDGNLHNWWTEKDHRLYAQKTHRLVTQYDSYMPLPGVHINGALTQGENIADLAGLEVAYFAYHLAHPAGSAPVIDGLSADQRFYLGYAQSFLSKRRPESLAGLLASDPHSPEKYRVNGVVSQMSSFYEAFHVKPGDGMYLAPGHRVTLW
jgi:predicted metalloendopeptidase